MTRIKVHVMVTVTAQLQHSTPGTMTQHRLGGDDCGQPTSVQKFYFDMVADTHLAEVTCCLRQRFRILDNQHFEIYFQGTTKKFDSDTQPIGDLHSVAS